MTADQRLISERFPRSSRYHPEWVLANVSGGAHALWLTEWLTEAITETSGAGMTLVASTLPPSPTSRRQKSAGLLA